MCICVSIYRINKILYNFALMRIIFLIDVKNKYSSDTCI